MTKSSSRKRKSSKKKSSTTLGESPDLARLKAVARKILGYLEQAVESGGLLAEDCTPQQKNDLLFINKHSLVASLMAVSELLLRLEDAPQQAAEGDGDAPISETDMLLLQHFIARQQGGDPAP